MEVEEEEERGVGNNRLYTSALSAVTKGSS